MSIRKRKWKTAAGEEREAWIAAYTDQHGKRHIRTFDRKKDAENFHAATHIEVRAGVHTAPSDSLTVEQAGAQWLASKAALERSTWLQYKSHVDLHIVPILGGLKLAQLTAPMVRHFANKLQSDEIGGGPRSRALTRKILTRLGSILADAQSLGLVGRNVVRELGKGWADIGGRDRSKLRIGTDIPSPAEIQALIAAAEPRWRVLLATAAFAGLRASELRGLRWADVDLKKSELHVQQRADRFNKIGRPKSRAGERTVPVPAPVLSLLKEWKLACPNGGFDLVFPNDKGGILAHEATIHRALIPAQLAGGITVPVKDADGRLVEMRAKYTGLHSLRHFYASWSINRKVDGGLELPAKVVQERLGHASITITLDRYGHLFPRGDDAGALDAAAARLLFPA